MLVEAKSYPAEFRDVGGGTAAEDSRRDLIARRLAETRQWLGVDENVPVAERWLGDYYQSANRFATLRFFRAFTVNNWKEQPTDAWLVNVYFVDDQSHVDAKRATSRAVWDTKIAEAEEELGLAGKPVPHSGRVFLKAGNYEELVAATGGSTAPPALAPPTVGPVARNAARTVPPVELGAVRAVLRLSAAQQRPLERAAT